MRDIPLKCHCAQVSGVAHDVSPKTGNRIVCYCDDCQGFARYLGHESPILDDNGGTDIFQMYPNQLNITQGIEQLRSMRLSEKGLLRWYTDCCKTPVGNTISYGVPFVGLIHNFMSDPDHRNEHLGPVKFYVQGQHAIGSLDNKTVHRKFPVRCIIKIASMMLKGKLTSKQTPSPFFDVSGVPVWPPVIADQF